MQLLTALRREIGGSDVEHGLAAFRALGRKAMRRTCICRENTRRKLRVRVELQAELNDVLILAALTRRARTNDEVNSRCG